MIRLLCAVAAIALVAPTAANAQRQNDRDQTTAPLRSSINSHSSRSKGRSSRQHQQQRQDRQNNNRTSSDRQQRPMQNARATHEHGSTRSTMSRPSNRSSPYRSTGTTTRNIYRIGHRPTTYHRIQVSSFQYPHGYNYRRWNIGAILPRLFLSSPYYWSDYGALGLLAPPPGYVWVRYGPDLLLVNRYTGRVADVIYGAFY